MGRFSFTAIIAIAAVFATAGRRCLAQHEGERGRERGWSGYQRRAFDWNEKRDHRNFRHHNRWVSPPVSSGWFQRPYPYHLDYYKMRYHGSYAPYFGNLYGSPQVVTAPPYFGPYYGNWGAGDYPAEGVGGYPPSELAPPGVMFAAPSEPGATQSGQTQNGAARGARSTGDELPVPPAP